VILGDIGPRHLCVVGFPKSGNTWVARLLAEATNSNIEAGHGDAVNSIDNSPDRDGSYVIHKRHFIYSHDSLCKGSIVYIVRDVRDVMVSGFFFSNRWMDNNKVNNNLLYKWYFNHELLKLNRCWRGNMLDNLVNKYRDIKTYLSGCTPKQIPHTNWSDDVIYWSNQPGVTIVRYEDLLANTESEMRRVLEKLGIEVSDEVLSRAVSNQNFDSRKSKFLSEGDEINAGFMRTGRSGGWKDYLTPEVAKDIEAMHQVAMREYGYRLEYLKGGDA